jgi:hypothetical protein
MRGSVLGKNNSPLPFFRLCPIFILSPSWKWGRGGVEGFDANKETKYGASVKAVNSNNSTNAAFLSQGLFADPAPLFNDTIFKN